MWSHSHTKLEGTWEMKCLFWMAECPAEHWGSLKRLHPVWFCFYNILERMGKKWIQKWVRDPWSPGVGAWGEREVMWAVKGSLRGALSRNCSVSVVVVTCICTRDHIIEKEIYRAKQAWILIKLVNFAGHWIVSISVSWCDGAHSLARCYHWGKLGKGYMWSLVFPYALTACKSTFFFFKLKKQKQNWGSIVNKEGEML